MKSTIQSTPRRAGFTLIELLIVISILAVIIALAVGVGKYVIGEAARKRTETAQCIIKSAIEEYRNENENAIPDDNGAGAGSTKHLLVQLETCDKSWQIIANLDKEILTSITEPLLDGWGIEMIYDQDGGIGGSPVIISGGPDQDIDTEADNIRSDNY